MRKILFVGPSLPDASAMCGDAIEVLPPAAHGDVLAAVRAGATVIGIIDGNFEHVAPVWHKEVLHALDVGVSVLGAASMGALRAAECDAFGMIGIGRVYEDYAAGRRLDDADVALLHGPAELGYPALSLPLVNVDATLDRLQMLDVVATSDISRLRTVADALFYKDRTWSAIVKAAFENDDRGHLLQLLHATNVNQKREDALLLVEAMRNFEPVSPAKQGNWTFRATTLWRTAADQPGKKQNV
ncbi:antibiotic resistance protein [Shinella sp. WSJ-2]|uniref:TfuA-like protein n=1 Tax=Shinella sp. WSJ-2 TaxID=2303749 RepID=UPI000E3ED608|nr:TfuA-like protein [Shinella sp. WSJ-2]MBO9629347.1 TfuA-like protein [Shinella sp.]RFZ87231.1 antibiotic resistance protein [Shinella sp. WSJ-2]